VGLRAPSPDPPNHMISTAFPPPHPGRQTAGQGLVALRSTERAPQSLSSPQPLQNSGLCLSHSQRHLGSPLDLDTCCPRGHEHGSCGMNGKLPSTQAAKSPMASSGSEYTKKKSIRRESPEAENQPFFKTLQLVSHNFSNAGDQAQCPEH
jgi:hypothetical protein